MWPKIVNPRISTREVIKSILNRFDQKKQFFEWCSWFKFNNLGLELGMALKFYTRVAKWLKLKVKNFLGLIPSFIEVREEKLVGGLFCPPSWIGLNHRPVYWEDVLQNAPRYMIRYLSYHLDNLGLEKISA